MNAFGEDGGATGDLSAVESVSPQPASPADIVAVLRDSAFRLPPAAVALHPLLCDAAARLIAVARATGREVAVISARDAGGILWHGASAGDYLYDSARPAWCDPRPGDADFLWGERARAVVESLAEAHWEQLAGPGRDSLCLVARAGGAWLAIAGAPGGPAEFHAVHADRPLELAAMLHPEETRSLADIFRALAPLRFVSVEQFAELVVAGEPAPKPEPEPVAEAISEEPAEAGPEDTAPPSRMLDRLLRRR